MGTPKKNRQKRDVALNHPTPPPPADQVWNLQLDYLRRRLEGIGTSENQVYLCIYVCMLYAYVHI